jgi:hypothetical protein
MHLDDALGDNLAPQRYWCKAICNSDRCITVPAVSHLSKCGGPVKCSHYTISLHHQLGYIYYILYNNDANCKLKFVSRKEKVAIFINSFSILGLDSTRKQNCKGY